MLINDFIRILNLDNSLLLQKKLLSEYTSEIIDLSQYSVRSRYWASVSDLNSISNLIPDPKNIATFSGSGDYHQVSYSLIKKFTHPISVIIFDNHPDWDLVGPKGCCGCWINLLLRMPNVVKVVHLGCAGSDLTTKGIQTANITSLSNNRMEIYPFLENPSCLFFRTVGKNYSVQVQRKFFSTRIMWRSLKDVDLADHLDWIVERLPSKDVYISIDKDCLKKEFAITNWDNGQLDLENLLASIRLFKQKTNIAGLDVNGEFSNQPRVTGFIKKRLSSLDHPSIKDYPADEIINEVNEKTNLAILKALFS